MELVTYGWIGACVLAPTISAICVVVLFLFNVYKGQWRNVDHFLVALTVQEILSAILCFALSILNLLHNRNEQICNVVTGLWFSIRILQLVTLTSLAVDRALILKWPYQYRFTIRSFQIKSHLIFMAFCCSLLALFAYSARLDQTTIQSLLNDLPTSSFSSNLAYFDFFSDSKKSFDVVPSKNLNENIDLRKNFVQNSFIKLPKKFTNEKNQSFPPVLRSIRSSSNLESLQISSTYPPSLNSNTVSMNQGQNLLFKQISVCTLHPLAWQRTFNIILLALFAALSSIILLCFVYVDCARRSSHKRKLIAHANYLSLSNYLNKKNLRLINIKNVENGYNLNHKNYFNKNKTSKNTSNSPGNTNTTTTTYTSDNPFNQQNNQQTSSSNSNNKFGTSLSTIAIGEQLSKNATSCLSENDKNFIFEQNTGSTSALCSMIDSNHDLATSTDALAHDELNQKKSKMHLLSKSQPSLLLNQTINTDSMDKKENGCNISVYSYDGLENKYKKQFKKPRFEAKPPINQLKNRLPVRSFSMITPNNLHLDDNEPYSLQSREELFSRKYLRDHYKICDLRWCSVVTCTSLCYAVNHAPTVVLLLISLLMPQYWTLLNENILVWFSLIQGLLLPICLYIADTPFRDAVRYAFKRKQSSDLNDLFYNKTSNKGICSLPGHSFAPSAYLTALNDDFCKADDASLLRIYNNKLLAGKNSLTRQTSKLSCTKTNESILNDKPSKKIIGNQLFYSNSNLQKYSQPHFNNRFGPKKFISSSNLNIAGYHGYANNDFLLLDKPILNGPYSGASVHGGPDPRRYSFSCFLSNSGFPGYSTIAEKTHYSSSNKINNDALKNQLASDLLDPSTVKCYQQLFANSVKFEQQLNALNNENQDLISCVSNGKLPQNPSFTQLHMTKTNPVYLTNDHFLPNSRKSLSNLETLNENNLIEKIEKVQKATNNINVEIKENNINEYKFKDQRLFDSPENSLECPLLDQLNSIAISSDGDYQQPINKNAVNLSTNGKFKCSRLANVGLLSNVASLAQTGARIQPQNKMKRLFNNRKLDLKENKQRRSFSGEISCELLNSLDSVDENQIADWPESNDLICSKSDTERDSCESLWDYSIKKKMYNKLPKIKETNQIYNKNESIVVIDENDDLSLKRPKLIVDDQLNLVDIENAIRNSTNLLNLSVFNVPSDDEEEQNIINKNKELLLKMNKLKSEKMKDDNISFCELDFTTNANDDFEFCKIQSNEKETKLETKKQLTKLSSFNSKEKKLYSKNDKKDGNSNLIKFEINCSKNNFYKKKSNETKLADNLGNKNELDYRRKSITTITPLSSNSFKLILNGKQSKSVSDLTAQFESNCLKANITNKYLPKDKKNKNIDENIENQVENKHHLPTSTALMLKLIKQTNDNKIEPKGKKDKISSETITKKRVELHKTPSSSSDASKSDDNQRFRQNRYLKKDEKKLNKKETKILNQDKNQPPHFRLLSASGFNLTNSKPIIISNTDFCKPSSSFYKKNQLVNHRPYAAKKHVKQFDLKRSNSTTSLALNPNCMLTSVKSMPNLISSNLFPYSFQ